MYATTEKSKYSENILFDLGKNGRLVGIEILDYEELAVDGQIIT